MDWQTSITLISILAGSLSLGMAFLLWQYRSLASMKPLMGTSLAVTLWALLYTLEIQSGADFGRLVWWSRAKLAGAVFVEVFVLMFVLDYIGQRILRWRTTILLIFPILTLIVAWSNPNDWFWQSVSVAQMEDVTYLNITMGWWRIAFLAYQYVVLLVAMVLLLIKERNLIQRLLITFAFLLPIIVRQATLSNNFMADFTPLAYTAMLAILIFSVLQIGMFDVLPDAYDTVIKNNPDGILVMDTRNRILMMNPTFAKFASVSNPRAVGSNLFDIFPDIENWLDGAATVRAGMVEATYKGRNIELRIIPLFDGATFKGRSFLLRDITDRKRAEQAVRDSEARYRTLFDQALDAIIVEDHKLNIIDANRATTRLLGYSYQDLLTMTSDVIQPEAMRFDTPAIQNGRIDMHAVRKDGSKMDVEVTIAPIPDKDKLIYMSIMRDVTERKRTQAELKQRADELAQLYEQVSQLEQYKTDMIRMAAHDVRHPITVALGYVELMEDEDNPLTETQRDFVNEIKKSVNRANQMLSDILSLERIEELAAHGTKDPFNFHSLLGEIIAQFRDQALAKSQKVFLEIDVDDEPYDMAGNKSQIAEAIGNLLVNAIKYTPNGGEIVIRLSNNGNQLIFEVRDTGYGIPKELQEKLFRPFYRAKTTETAHVEGTGLGLHLVKSIVERHSGQVSVKSVHGEGSTFGFRLPLLRRGAVVPPQADMPRNLSTAEVPRVTLPTVD
jgi:PAS domain S-box-containing protein